MQENQDNSTTPEIMTDTEQRTKDEGRGRRHAGSEETSVIVDQPLVPRPSSPAPSPAGREYLERLARSRRQPALSLDGLIRDLHACGRVRSRFRPYPYQASELYALAAGIYGLRLSALGRRPVWDPATERVFEGLLRYFAGDREGPYDLTRGIYLFGPFGSGKSVMMQTFMDFTRLVEKRLEGERIFTPRSYRVTVCRDISTDMMATGRADLRPYMLGARLFDDLGNEDGKMIYGNEIQPMTDILLRRYDSYQREGLITHATSNLAPHECREVYGERIGSRVWEMFNHVFLDAKDKRR